MKRSLVVNLVCGMVAALIALPAFAQEATPAANMPEWMNISFKTKSFLSDIYKHSIAQGVWLKTKNRPDFLPPIQYIVRPLKTKMSEQSFAMTNEILANLGVKPVGLHSPSLIVRSGAFKATHGLPAIYQEIQSTQDGRLTTTCMAFVQNGQQVTAVYAQGTKDVLTKCTHELVTLAQSDLFIQKPGAMKITSNEIAN